MTKKLLEELVKSPQFQKRWEEMGVRAYRILSALQEEEESAELKQSAASSPALPREDEQYPSERS